MPRVSAPLILKKRAEFLAVQRSGLKWVSGSIVLQAAPKAPDPTTPPLTRYGITVTKKQGNAVLRNRVKRRFRALLRASDLPVKDGWDYVLIGRAEAASLSFSKLEKDLRWCLTRLHEKHGS